MRVRFGWIICVAAVLLLLAPCAHAQDDSDDDSPALPNLPGLSTDARAYETSLRQRYPAGASQQVMQQAAQAARTAATARDVPHLVTALETLVGGLPSNQTAGFQAWSALAQAQLSLTPPDARHALLSASLALNRVPSDSPDQVAQQVAAMRLMRQALAGLHQGLPEMQVLTAIARRLPDDPIAQGDLRRRQLELGLLFRQTTTDAESFPARACLAFLGNPSPSPDFHPGDWVTLDPPVKDAAVTLESRRICISGLPAGATTTATLRHGMPGEGELSLKQDTAIRIAMPDRQARLVFDGSRFLQPRGAQATVALDAVNLSAVKLALLKIDERNLKHVMDTYGPGQSSNFDSDTIHTLQTTEGRVVWQGSADVAHFARNALTHTVLPLPAPLSDPGLYVLIATPGDGTPFNGYDTPVAAQMILRTDLAPTVWHGAEGDTVQIRSYATGLPVSGAKADLLATDNEILASAQTGADGTLHFAQPLLAGTDALAPAALHITTADGHDFTRLGLGTPDFDLSDRGVAGNAPPGPVDPFIWTDRGIYRPGETVQVMALLRDDAGQPADLPLHLIVTRPDGRVFQDSVPPRAAGNSLHVPVTLSPGAAFGDWTIALKTDPKGPAIAQRDFKVDAFIPPRLAVDITPPALLEPGRTTAVPVAVRFLYGAPGNGLSGDATVTLQPDPTPFKDFAQYRFGLSDDRFTSDQRQVDIDDTDDAGHTSLPVDLSKLPDTSVALRAALAVNINDPAGRNVMAQASLPIRPAAPMIGISPDFKDGSVDANAPAGFHIVAVAPSGQRAAMKVQLRLVRQTPDWRLAVVDGHARYETVWRDAPVDSQDVTLAADGAPFAYAKPLPFGRYRLQVLQAAGGMAASSMVFYSGWATGDNPDVPARVAVRADHERYKPGDTATIHVEAPFAGPATVLVMTDRVKTLVNVTPPTASFDVQVPVTADWGAGAYVGVHVFHPADEATHAPPARAIGLTWVAMDPAPRTLPLAIATDAVYRPRTTASIAVKTAPGAWVSLAAVDEGILSLTGFRTPDPLSHYFGQRSLGVGIHDDWARLLTPAGDANTILRQGAGGDVDMNGATTTIPQTIVALFAGPVQAGPDGVATFPLAFPDFDGTLRLMAVGWDGARTGSLGQDITLRDKLIAEPLLPRFLAPGDQAQVAVLLQNIELPPGDVKLHLSATGTLSLTGADPAPVALAANQRRTVPVALSATGNGPGTLTLAVDGPGGFHAEHAATIDVHPARGSVAQITPVTLAPGETRSLAPDTAAFIPGTWTASASFGLGVRYDPAALVQALQDYPLDCLEQLTSKGLPLAMLTGPAAGPQRDARLAQVIQALGDRQRFDGGFGLWSANGDAEPWLTAYATDFLLRARKSGATVPEVMTSQALDWLATEVATPPSSPTDRAAQAYALYVLALAGRTPAGAVRVAATELGKEPTPLARAQIGAALARMGEAQQARAVLAGVIADPARNYWPVDYGTSLRDQLATAVLVQEAAVPGIDLAAIRNALPGANLDPATLNTQEQGWAAAAAGALGNGAPPVSLAADGKTLGPAPRIGLPLTAAVSLRNPGAQPLPGSVVVQGVPITAPAAAHAGLTVTRHFFHTDGSPVDPDKLPQNTSFLLQIDGHVTDGQAHSLMVLSGLPAGWEIAGRLPSGKVAGMDWLGELTDTDAQGAADDRYSAVVTLGKSASDFRLAVLLRAVTPGTFEYPGLNVSDMYRPAVFARQGAVRLSILPAP